MIRLRHRTGSRLAGAVLVAWTAMLVPALSAGPARAATGPAGAGATASLLGQTPWVETSGTFSLRLRLPAGLPAGDHMEIQAYTRLTTRTDFDTALKATPPGIVWYSTGPLSLSALSPDPARDVDVRIPVNQAAPAGSTIPTLDATVGSGVYPIQIGLYDQNGLLQGQPLTTFLVYAAGPPSATSLPRLSVALVLPFHASPTVNDSGQIGAPSASAADRLGVLANELNASPLSVNLEVTPQTVAALKAGNATDQTTADVLNAAVAGGPDAALPSPYVRISITDMEGSGLASEVDQQLKAGAQTLAAAFGSAPSESTWVVNGPIDATTVSTLVAAGATHLIVPDSDLTALPSSVTETTFARPTGLAVPGNPKLTVYGADTQITADFASQEPPVLAANQLLAELAMIQLETPGITRGVVALPPPGWSENPTFVSTLLNGLQGHPLLSAVSAASLFAAVPTAPIVRQLASSSSGPPTTNGSGSSVASSSTTAVPTTPSSGPAPAPSLAGDAGQIRTARQQASATSAILPSNPALAATLERQVLVSESLDVTEGQRQALLGSVAKASGRVFGQISLPGSSSITLTSTKAQIPLTILLKGSIKAHIALQLTSQRLLFQPFVPPNGTCTVPTPTSETCQLSLVDQNTTLKIPVQTRSSGVFPLNVALVSPDGSVTLARDLYTVRSTAISGVGVVLIVLAVVSLALWWVRDLRRGRRARRLVPSPVDPEADDDLPGTGLGAAPLSGDPVVDDFFTRPPPEYVQPGR